MSDENKLKQIVEAALLAAGGPLSLDAIQDLFLEDAQPEKRVLREAIGELQNDYQGRGMELIEVAGGFRINVRASFAPWVSRLWEERPARYSRALLETLALIAYRQPITRGEIEEIRGVSVSTNIMKTLIEREWVRVVGQRDVPGKPSLYATTREFLNYFSLKSLEELPTLQEIRDLDSINQELEFEETGKQPEPSAESDDQPAGEIQEEMESDDAIPVSLEVSASDRAADGDTETEEPRDDQAPLETTETVVESEAQEETPSS